MRNKVAMVLAILAGVLLLNAGVTGAATWETIQNFVVGFLGDHWALILVFRALIFIASFGGVAVICGGVLIGAGRTLAGKLFIMLGAGAGLLGLVLAVILPWFRQGSASLALGTATGTFGIIFSVAARMMAK